MEHDALLLLARNGEATPWKLSRNEENGKAFHPDAPAPIRRNC
jgi:hypothetical protein